MNFYSKFIYPHDRIKRWFWCCWLLWCIPLFWITPDIWWFRIFWCSDRPLRKYMVSFRFTLVSLYDVWRYLGIFRWRPTCFPHTEFIAAWHECAVAIAGIAGLDQAIYYWFEPRKDCELGRVLGALVFACHPLAVYGVGYLIQRSILMATMFTLVMQLAYLRGLLEGDKRYMALAVMAYFWHCSARNIAWWLPHIATFDIDDSCQNKLSSRALLALG